MPPKRMTANPMKPLRYRPGKPIAPEDSDSSESESDESDDEQQQQKSTKKPTTTTTATPEAPARVSAALKKVDLNKRFEESRKEEEERAAAEARKREEEESSDYSTAEEEEEEEGESEDEEEVEEEEEEAPKRVYLRPTFIPKGKRNASAVSAIPDPEALAKVKAEEEARKKAEAAALLEEHIRRDAAAKAAGRKGWDDDEDDGEGLDDTDDLDPVAERAAWKTREIARVKREREELGKIEKEREEIERRRAMDPELRNQEDMEYVKKQHEEKKESRGKMGFLQKYYHKGAFYQEDSEILKKNYSTATVEDEVKNRDVLPKYMQVRGDEVGKRGRTRWTHLSAEDTSMQNGGSPWFDKNGINKRATGKLGGMHEDERFRPDERRQDRGGDGYRRGFEDKGNRDRDFGDRKPPEGPRGYRGGDRGGGYGDRYAPNGGRSGRDRSSSPRDRDRDRGRYERDRDEGRYDRDRKRAHSPPRRRRDDGDGGDKRRRTEVR